MMDRETQQKITALQAEVVRLRESLNECDRAISAMAVGIQVHNDRASRRGEARIEGPVPANLMIAGVNATKALRTIGDTHG